jgi:hypothetical protein
MLAGVGLFGTLSGIIASIFVGSRSQETADGETTARLKRIEEKLALLSGASVSSSASRNDSSS